MRISYCGNFKPAASTENHVKSAFENQGHTVTAVQEGDDQALRTLMSKPQLSKTDLILWTRTADLAAKWGHKRQLDLLKRANSFGVPTVGFHLDRWWGLRRQHEIVLEPFFQCDYVITADGGHDDLFNEAGVNHFWLPPAVSLAETELGEPQQRYTSDVAFVGSWQAGYHPEWPHRAELVQFLQAEYGQEVRFWPQPNQHAIRGDELRNLYASVKVVVGDSCLVGGTGRYISDRVPETLGRGACLIHPHVEGVTDGSLYTAGEHLLTWPLGDWNALRRQIQWSLSHPDERAKIAVRGRAHVKQFHTYEVRTQSIIDLVL